MTTEPSLAPPPAAPPSSPFAPPRADRAIGVFEVERLRGVLVAEPDVDLTPVAWAPAPLLLGEGWDNTIWDVGSLPDGTPLALRVARREVAVELLEHEVLVLRHLAGRADALPMRLPGLLATADASVLVTWIFGHTALDGDDAEQTQCATALASMLAALHGAPPAGLDRNPVRGCPLADRDERLRADLDDVLAPEPDLAARALGVWETGLAAPVWTGPDVLLHGDPHPANVIVADDGSAPVLIDLGDTTPGDPASDLGALALHRADALAPGSELLGIYRREASWPGIDEDAVFDALVLRARAWTVRLAVTMLAAHGPDEGLGRAAARALRAL